MRSKGAEATSTLEGDSPENGEASGSVPQWVSGAQSSHSSSADLLYVNLEETFPPSPPFLERDPNMSSTARYSPLHGNTTGVSRTPAIQHPPLFSSFNPSPEKPIPSTSDMLCNETGNILAVGSFILSSESNPNTERIDDINSSDITHFMRSYSVNVDVNTVTNPLQNDKLVPLLNAIDNHSRNDDTIQSEIHENFYTQQVYNPNDTYGVPDSSEAVYLTSTSAIDTISSSVPILNSAPNIQLVYSSNDILTEVDDSTNFMKKQNEKSNQLNLFKKNKTTNQENDISLEKFDIPDEENLNSQDYIQDDISCEGRRNRKQFPSSDDISITCIPDKSVPCRAKASLPISHLLLGNNKSGDPSILSVYARRRIPLRARFGPLEGITRPLDQNVLSSYAESDPKFFIQIKNQNFYIDVSDEKTSNWMRYVRFSPGADQNVCLQQLGDKLYFTSTKPISPYGELILGYSAAYINHWSLPVPTQSDDNDIVDWPCYECSKQFTSSADFQDHLNTHDEDIQVRKTKKKNVKNTNITNQRCNICNRVFPRNYSLKRHMKTHSLPSSKIDINNAVLNENNSMSPSNTSNDLLLANLDSEQSFHPDSTSVEMKIEDESILNEKIFKDNLSVAMEVEDSIMNTNTSDSIEMIESNDCFESKENMCIENQQAAKINCQSNGINNMHKNSMKYSESCENETSHVKEVKLEHAKLDKSYDCPKCENSFQEFDKLNIHIKENHGIQKFHCKTCSTDFNTSEDLRLHLLKHSNHMDFSCPNCGKQFKRKDKLKEHIKKQRRAINNNKEIIYLCAERANGSLSNNQTNLSSYLLFTFKCHPCRRGFKRRGMLVNHLARRHPEISRASVPELQLPILRKAREYFCQHCNKVYKSSSKRKAHILKNHPGESLPPSSRDLAGNESNDIEVLGYSACVGAITSNPHSCPYAPCHKQYASKAKLSQHIRHKHLSNGSTNKATSEKSEYINGIGFKNDSIINKEIHNTSPTPSMDDLLSSEDNTYSQVIERNQLTNSPTHNSQPLMTADQIYQITSDMLNDKIKMKNFNHKQKDIFEEKSTDAYIEDFSDQINTKVITKSAEENTAEEIIKEMPKLSDEILFNYDKGCLDDYLCSFGPNCLPLMVLLTPNIEICEKNDAPQITELQEKCDESYNPLDTPKVHISGHILSVEGNKLLPMNMLSSKNQFLESSLSSQYTDR